MYDLIIVLEHVVLAGLDEALRTEFGERISGVSGGGGSVRAHFFEEYTGADEVAAQALVDAHDPAFLSAVRDGDEVAITVSLPRNVGSATEITLTVDGVAFPEAIALTDGVGSAVVASEDVCTIGVQGYVHEAVTV